MIGKCLIVICVLTLGAHGHDWGFGSCPTIAPFENLSIDKFLGMWYVIEQFDTTSTCLTFNYTRTSETSLEISKHRQFYMLDRAGLDHTNTYTGSLDIPFASNPGVLRVKWPLNIAGKGDYIIFDTDYKTYAGVYDCQQISFFMYRQSAAILSRTPNLDDIYVERVKNKLNLRGVDVSEFNKIDHSKCRGRDSSDFNIKVDQDTFKDIFTGTVDAIKDTANKVADGVSEIATSVSNLGNSGTPLKEAAEFTTEFPDPSFNEIEILN